MGDATTLSDSVTRKHANLGSIISTFWFRECELLEGYHQALAKLSRGGGPAPAQAAGPCRGTARR